MESASLAQLTFDPDPATHHFHKPFADAKPQSGAGIFSRSGGVGLAERFKKFVDVFRCYPNTCIFYKKCKCCMV